MLQQIFEQVLARGKLTPAVLQAFTTSGHDQVLQRVHSLDIQDLPAVLPLTRNLWLGVHACMHVHVMLLLLLDSCLMPVHACRTSQATTDLLTGSACCAPWWQQRVGMSRLGPLCMSQQSSLCVPALTGMTTLQ